MKTNAHASITVRLKANGSFGFISPPLLVVLQQSESTYKQRAIRFVVVLRSKGRYYRCKLDLGLTGIVHTSEKQNRHIKSVYEKTTRIRIVLHLRRCRRFRTATTHKDLRRGFGSERRRDRARVR